jgi:hypothetical protein
MEQFWVEKGGHSLPGGKRAILIFYAEVASAERNKIFLSSIGCESRVIE